MPARSVHEGAIDNTAIVADNDFMWHRVRPTGRVEDGMVTLSRDAELVRVDAGQWAIRDDGADRAVFPTEKLRVSLSWKALALDDEADRRRHDEHTEDIDLSEVLQRFSADFAARVSSSTSPLIRSPTRTSSVRSTRRTCTTRADPRPMRDVVLVTGRDMPVVDTETPLLLAALL